MFLLVALFALGLILFIWFGGRANSGKGSGQDVNNIDLLPVDDVYRHSAGDNDNSIPVLASSPSFDSSSSFDSSPSSDSSYSDSSSGSDSYSGGSSDGGGASDSY
jgi:hypothetical protein